MLKRTMTQYDKEEEAKLNILTPKKIQLVPNSTCNNHQTINEINLGCSTLNFNFGYAGIAIYKLVGHADIELVARA